jgi:hypothetical protein
LERGWSYGEGTVKALEQEVRERRDANEMAARVHRTVSVTANRLSLTVLASLCPPVHTPLGGSPPRGDDARGAQLSGGRALAPSRGADRTWEGNMDQRIDAPRGAAVTGAGARRCAGWRRWVP